MDGDEICRMDYGDEWAKSGRDRESLSFLIGESRNVHESWGRGSGLGHGDVVARERECTEQINRQNLSVVTSLFFEFYTPW